VTKTLGSVCSGTVKHILQTNWTLQEEVKDRQRGMARNEVLGRCNPELRVDIDADRVDQRSFRSLLRRASTCNFYHHEAMSSSWYSWAFNFSLPSLNPSVSLQKRFISFVLKRSLGHLVKPGQLDAHQIDAQIGSGFVEVKEIELDSNVSTYHSIPLVVNEATGIQLHLRQTTYPAAARFTCSCKRSHTMAQSLLVNSWNFVVRSASDIGCGKSPCGSR
jgi:hypothetical protein